MPMTLHHIGSIVPSVEAAIAWHLSLGEAALVAPPRPTQDGGALIAFVARPGEPLLELIEPLAPEGELRAFLTAHPDGALHHLCYAVADIQACRAGLAARGAEFASPIVTGILGRPIFFVRPVSMGGILTEFIEI